LNVIFLNEGYAFLAGGTTGEGDDRERGISGK